MEFRRSEYDTAVAVAAIRKAGLPEESAARLWGREVQLDPLD